LVIFLMRSLNFIERSLFSLFVNKLYFSRFNNFGIVAQFCLELSTNSCGKLVINLILFQFFLHFQRN
jgi:hypothetical protein